MFEGRRSGQRSFLGVFGGGPGEVPERRSEENVCKLPSKAGVKLVRKEKGVRFRPKGPQKGLKMRFLEGFLEGFWRKRGLRSKFHENTVSGLSHLSLFPRSRSKKRCFGGFWGEIGFLKKCEIFRFLRGSREVLERGSRTGHPEERVGWVFEEGEI